MAHVSINMDSLKPRREFKRHQIQPGHNIYRILPPFGPEDVHNNYPYKKWTVAWLTDPTSGKRRPFALPPFDKNNPDPIFAYVNALTKKIETVKKAMEAKGIPAETIREKLKDLNQLVWELRPKAGFFYNACNKAGEVGILELKKTAHDALKTEMYQYIKDYSQDPTSLSSDDDDAGVWFDIERVGEKGDKNTEYKVKKSQNKRKDERGKLVFEDDREPLPEHVVQNFSSLGYDIYGLYQAKTNEELRAILLENLKEVVKVVPAARIEGFDPDEAVSAAIPEEEVPFAPAPVKPQGKAPVKLAIELTEEDPEPNSGEPFVTAPAAKPVVQQVAKPVAKTVPIAKAAPVNTADDDIFALADSILNG